MIPPPPCPADAATWPASLQLLLGEPAGDLWSAVLGPLGGALRALRPAGVSLQPDGAATVQFSATVTWGDGRETREALAATTGSRIPPGAAVLEGDSGDGTVQVGLWRWPLDPALPGLAWAASASAVATGARLRELGLGSTTPRLRLRSYRPGRRAVIGAQTPDGPLFLKVVRPSAVEPLVARHGLLAGAVPVPAVLAATPDGVVVLPGLAGTPLRAVLSVAPAGRPTPRSWTASSTPCPRRSPESPAAGACPATGWPGPSTTRACWVPSSRRCVRAWTG